jgi:hypothetical protein
MIEKFTGTLIGCAIGDTWIETIKNKYSILEIGKVYMEKEGQNEEVF